MTSFIKKALYQLKHKFLYRITHQKQIKSNIEANKNNIDNTTIIGGSDGPTSIFIAKPDREQRKKREEEFQLKCKKLKPNGHSFEELVNYVITTYHARKLPTDSRSYIEEFRNIKSALILRERPDLVTTPMPSKPEEEQLTNQNFMVNYLNQINRRSEEAYEIEDHIFPINFEQYEILVKSRKSEGKIIINFEYIFEVFNISYQYSGKNIKREKINTCKKIVKDIYRFYGVTKEDIEQQNKRCRTYIREVESK